MDTLDKAQSRYDAALNNLRRTGTIDAEAAVTAAMLNLRRVRSNVDTPGPQLMPSKAKYRNVPRGDQRGGN